MKWVRYPNGVCPVARLKMAGGMPFNERMNKIALLGEHHEMRGTKKNDFNKIFYFFTFVEKREKKAI